MGLEDHGADARPATLEEETRTVIEEARMVLPGIQAFFGFQLIAVFNSRFQDLTHMEQVLHLVALLMLTVSIALIMTPAAYLEGDKLHASALKDLIRSAVAHNLSARAKK